MTSNISLGDWNALTICKPSHASVVVIVVDADRPVSAASPAMSSHKSPVKVCPGIRSATTLRISSKDPSRDDPRYASTPAKAAGWIVQPRALQARTICRRVVVILGYRWKAVPTVPYRVPTLRCRRNLTGLQESVVGTGRHGTERNWVWRSGRPWSSRIPVIVCPCILRTRGGRA